MLIQELELLGIMFFKAQGNTISLSHIIIVKIIVKININIKFKPQANIKFLPINKLSTEIVYYWHLTVKNNKVLF